jgi:hypothetical protein
MKSAELVAVRCMDAETMKEVAQERMNASHRSALLGYRSVTQAVAA